MVVAPTPLKSNFDERIAKTTQTNLFDNKKSNVPITVSSLDSRHNSLEHVLELSDIPRASPSGYKEVNNSSSLREFHSFQQEMYMLS